MTILGASHSCGLASAEGEGQTQPMRVPLLPSLNLATKVALVALLAFGAFSGLDQFEGKAFGSRLATYPLAVLVLPALWAARRMHPRYPHGADVLLGLPFLIDVSGNALDVYDTVEWWDDANHFVNWWLLSSGAGALLLRHRLGRLTTAGIVLGFGAVSAILWELAEYVSFIRNSPELATAYTDTLGDLGLGLAGSACAAMVASLLARELTVDAFSGAQRHE